MGLIRQPSSPNVQEARVKTATHHSSLATPDSRVRVNDIRLLGGVRSKWYKSACLTHHTPYA